MKIFSQIEVRASGILLTTVIALIHVGGIATAQTAAEFSCRTKAKEIAADTYKGCMTEQRQSQLEQIRKEYKEKLSELKSHYDKELKKMSGGKSTEPSESPTTDVVPNQKKLSRSTTRASGARSLPAKKGPVKSQSIDLSSPTTSGEVESNETVPTESPMAPQADNRLKTEQDGASGLEFVDLPSQE
jgi:hypothetical protein